MTLDEEGAEEFVSQIRKEKREKEDQAFVRARERVSKSRHYWLFNGNFQTQREVEFICPKCSVTTALPLQKVKDRTLCMSPEELENDEIGIWTPRCWLHELHGRMRPHDVREVRIRIEGRQYKPVPRAHRIKNIRRN